MEKQLGKEYRDKESRLRFLKDNCSKIEEKGYMKPFPIEEMQSYKEDLANISITISELEVAKKIASDSYKTQLKPLHEERQELLSNIKQKAIFTREICYKFTDTDEKLTGYYNADGDLVECRPATIDELQPTIFSLKTGTNN